MVKVGQPGLRELASRLGTLTPLAICRFTLLPRVHAFMGRFLRGKYKTALPSTHRFTADSTQWESKRDKHLLA
eukprot:11207462-Prorocentrum_lima.AAC.1